MLERAAEALSIGAVGRAGDGDEVADEEGIAASEGRAGDLGSRPRKRLPGREPLSGADFTIVKILSLSQGACYLRVEHGDPDTMNGCGGTPPRPCKPDWLGEEVRAPVPSVAREEWQGAPWLHGSMAPAHGA